MRSFKRNAIMQALTGGLSYNANNIINVIPTETPLISSAYWRVRATSGTFTTSDGGNMSQIYEFELYESSDFTGTNLSLTGTASASDSYGSYGPWRANDGQPTSQWVSSGNSPAWLRVDLTKAYAIKSCRINWYAQILGYVPKTFNLEYSLDNGTTWKVAKEIVTPAAAVGPASYITDITDFNISLLATGGTITKIGSYVYHTFTTNGVFTPSTALNIEYLIVGGGSSGSMNNYHGSGGGGGGVLTGFKSLIKDNLYNVVVGVGGTGPKPVDYFKIGDVGTASSVFGNTTPLPHWVGYNDGYSGNGLAPTPAGGYNGGAGAGGVNSGAMGGAGLLWGNTGNYYGAGGGGYNGIGGSNIGGNGCTATTNGLNGVANTGAGGGCGSTQQGKNAGNGGSGIVIIRYLVPNTDPNIGTGFYAGVIPIGKLINKIIFNTTVTTTSSAALSVARYRPSSLVNSDKGYICGGALSATPWSSAVIDKLSFISETLASLSTVISATRAGMCGLSASIAGYNLGGSNPATNISAKNTDKFVYSTELNAILGVSLASSHGYGLPMSSILAGYCSGGWTGTATNTNRIDKILYSTDALSVLTATLIGNSSGSGCGGAQSSTKGYGFIGNNTTAVTGIEFSTETAFTGINALNSTRSNSATTSSLETAYVAGGSSVNSTSVTSYVFTNETCVPVSNVLQTPQSSAVGLSYN